MKASLELQNSLCFDADPSVPLFFSFLLPGGYADYRLQCDEEGDARPSKWHEEALEKAERRVQGEHGQRGLDRLLGGRCGS